MLEREKRKVLEGKTVTTIENAPLWNYRLASNSEANVKADKEPNKTLDELICESLQIILKLDESDGYSTGLLNKGNVCTLCQETGGGKSTYLRDNFST